MSKFLLRILAISYFSIFIACVLMSAGFLEMIPLYQMYCNAIQDKVFIGPLIVLLLGLGCWLAAGAAVRRSDTERYKGYGEAPYERMDLHERLFVEEQTQVIEAFSPDDLLYKQVSRQDGDSVATALRETAVALQTEAEVAAMGRAVVAALEEVSAASAGSLGVASEEKTAPAVLGNTTDVLEETVVTVSEEISADAVALAGISVTALRDASAAAFGEAPVMIRVELINQEGLTEEAESEAHAQAEQYRLEKEQRQVEQETQEEFIEQGEPLELTVPIGSQVVMALEELEGTVELTESEEMAELVELQELTEPEEMPEPVELDGMTEPVDQEEKAEPTESGAALELGSAEPSEGMEWKKPVAIKPEQARVSLIVPRFKSAYKRAAAAFKGKKQEAKANVVMGERIAPALYKTAARGFTQTGTVAAKAAAAVGKGLSQTIETISLNLFMICDKPVGSMMADAKPDSGMLLNPLPESATILGENTGHQEESDGSIRGIPVKNVPLENQERVLAGEENLAKNRNVLARIKGRWNEIWLDRPVETPMEITVETHIKMPVKMSEEKTDKELTAKPVPEGSKKTS